jgi:hypothetical protein
MLYDERDNGHKDALKRLLLKSSILSSLLKDLFWCESLKKDLLKMVADVQDWRNSYSKWFQAQSERKTKSPYFVSLCTVTSNRRNGNIENEDADMENSD